MTKGGLITLGLGALLLAGCAAPKALLLEGEDGHVGALAVLNPDGSEQILDSPLRSARLGSRSARLRTVTSVKPTYQQLLSNLPPPEARISLEFINGTTTITEGSRPRLEDIRAAIRSHPGAEVQVTGHTDSVGRPEYNDELSLRRANEVLLWLVEQGFPKDLMTAVGRGEREPVIDAGDEVPVEANRRVEVIVR
jgi:outer membrane protein OmpA-like peptidoglycan-associated protein